MPSVKYYDYVTFDRTMRWDSHVYTLDVIGVDGSLVYLRGFNAMGYGVEMSVTRARYMSWVRRHGVTPNQIA